MALARLATACTPVVNLKTLNLYKEFTVEPLAW
jgi:hypothetical protein